VWTSRVLGCITATTLAACGLTAQDNGSGSIAGPGIPAPAASVSAPVLGYFFDQDRKQLQSIVGIPGSGFPGAAIAPGSGAASLEISPAQDYALAVLPDSGRLARIPLNGDEPSAIPVEGAMNDISWIAISPGGSAALAYSATSRRAQVFTGFPDSPVLARVFDWSALPASLAAMAVNDAGDFALVAVQAEAAALYAVVEGYAPALVYTAQAISSVAFLRNSHEAVVAAPADNQVVWLRDSGGVLNPTVLSGGSAGISAPRVVSVSRDGSRVFALDSAAGIWSIPFSGAAVASASCACQPAQLQRMRGRDVFLLTPRLGSGLAVVDAGGEAMDVVLMPPEAPPAVALVGENKQ
jgi:hypothetical protein